MKKENIIYKPITNWMQADEISYDTKRRPLTKLILGEVRENKKTVSYYVEEIYQSYLEAVIRTPSNYKVEVKINKTPQLLIKFNGTLLLHNEKMQEYSNLILELLSTIPPKDIVDAYYEMRLNMNAKSKLKEATEYLTAFIRKKTEIDFSSAFIREMIHKYISEKIFSTKEMEQKELLRSLDYSDIIHYASQVILFEMDGTLLDEYLINICKGNDNPKEIIQQFKNDLAEELLFRLINGTIAER